MVGILGGAAPVIGESDTAGEGHGAVDDEYLAVGAVVDAIERPCAHVVEPDQAHARGVELGNRGGGQVVGAVAIEHDADVNAAAGSGHEGLREAGADLAVGVDEALEADAALRPLDRLQHRREDVIAVLQHVERIAAGHRRADQRGDVVGEIRVRGGHRAPYLQRARILQQPQETGHARECEPRPATSPLARGRGLRGAGMRRRHASTDASLVPSANAGRRRRPSGRR